MRAGQAGPGGGDRADWRELLPMGSGGAWSLKGEFELRVLTWLGRESPRLSCVVGRPALSLVRFNVSMPAYFNLQGSVRKAPHSPSRDTTRQRIKFSDDRVCKSHLLNCCPHDVLSGTRMDLGECLKVHDLALRADYEIASKEQDFFFELDAMDHLQSFIADCDRRTEVAKKRLAETQEEISAEVAAKAERVHELNEEIGKLLAKVEQLGAEGNVEESQKVMDEVEKARAKKREAEEVYRNSMPASSFQQQKLRVCEVCSAYLGLHDNDRRLADHFGGKLHLGFIEIREKLEELKRVVAEKQEKRNQERLKRREEREREEREKLRRILFLGLDHIARILKDPGPGSIADIDLAPCHENGKGELDPNPGRNAIATGPAPAAVVAAAATREVGTVLETGAESDRGGDPQKKDSETKT
ncbi:putative RNA-binding protein Luc7-like 2 isoform X3 [Odocoileus virginianus]|uniref:Luc7-like protein n=1 Tax=Odocoileus virginianus TaxID=9874 RepID=A0ABM4I035_ODOVR